MGGFHCDQHVPLYFNNVAVTSGTQITGPNQLLAGVQALAIQVTPTNGAAGTLYLDGSNSRSMDNPIVWVNISNQAVAANTPVLISTTLADQITGMHVMRLRFVPSASGNLLVAVNGRAMMY